MDLPKYCLSINKLNEGSSDLAQHKLRRHIDDEISLLETSSADESILYLQPFEADGWFIGLTAFPLAVYPYRFKMETYDDASRGPAYPLISYLKKKATRYGTLNRPYVIAINTWDYQINEKHLEDMLFGKRNEERTSNSEYSRGFWGTTTTPKNRRVSAVLFTNNLYAPTLLMGQYSASLYLNPWAKFCYDGVLTNLTTFRLEAGALKETPGSSLHEWLKLRCRKLW